MRVRALAILAVLAALILAIPSYALAATQNVTSDSKAWTAGTWVVPENMTVTIADRITVTGEVTLQLGKGATLNAEKGITVNDSGNESASNQLTITGEGTLVATGTTATYPSSDSQGGTAFGLPGIGCDGTTGTGTIVIAGGTVTATGAAATSDSQGSNGAAGIGGSGLHNDTNNSSGGGTIYITGGTVSAQGAADGGAGIGGGNCGGCAVMISGGTVTATGGTGAVDIGGGKGAPTSSGKPVTVEITGGKVTATTNGIGTGVTEGSQDGKTTVSLSWTSTDDYIKAKYWMPEQEYPTLLKAFYDIADSTKARRNGNGTDLPTYAQSAMKIVPLYYTVTFNTHGGTPVPSDQVVSSGSKAHKPSPDPTLDANHTFDGWYTDGSYAQEFDFDVEVESDLTLHARYKELPKATISFDANGGEGAMADQTVYQGRETKLNANTYTRKRYVFVGWNTAKDASGKAYADEAPVTLTSNLNLYAQWMYGVTWFVDVGKGAPTVEATNLETVAEALVSDDEASVGAEVRLEITAIASKNVDENEKSVAKTAMATKGAKAGAWFDISVYKQLMGAEAQKITKTPVSVELSVDVPTGLHADGRTYYLIGIHDGEARFLAETTGDVLNGKSDLFSTYLIAYKDSSSNADDSGNSKTNSKSTDKSSDSSSSSSAKGESLASTADSSHVGIATFIICGLTILAMGLCRRHA